MGNRIYGYLMTILDYIFVICLIYFGRSMWHSIVPSLTMLDKFMKYTLVASTILCIILSSGEKIKVSNYLILILYALVFFLFVIIRPYKGSYYIKTLIFAFSAVLYAFYRKEEYVKVLGRYQKVIILVSLVSLFFWIYGSVLHIIMPTGYVFSSWTGTDDPKRVATYYYIYFEPQSIDFLSWSGMTRNCSIFTEAPMCSLHLCIALIYELFLAKKTSLFKTILLIVCIMTSFSTTGYVVVASGIAVKYMVTGKNKKLVHIFKFISIPIVGIIAIYILAKLITTKMQSFSGNTRIDDFVAGFKAWRNNPIFGNGYENMDAIKHYMSAFRVNDMGYSNSPMALLAYGGIYIFIPYFSLIIIGIFKNFQDKNKLSYCLLFTFLWIFTIIPFIPLTAYLIVGILYLNNKKEVSFDGNIRSLIQATT